MTIVICLKINVKHAWKVGLSMKKARARLTTNPPLLATMVNIWTMKIVAWIAQNSKIVSDLQHAQALATRAAQRALTASLVHNAIALALPLQIVLFLLVPLRAIRRALRVTATFSRRRTVQNAWFSALLVRTVRPMEIATGPAQTLQIVLQILLLVRPIVIRFA